MKADEILVLCFTRAAISEIKKRLKGLNQNLKVNSIYARTFDSFATDFLIETDGENINLRELDYEQRIEQAIKRLRDRQKILDYRYLIVDEIQDLVGARARLVQKIIKDLDCGFLLLGDLCQGIYDYQVKDDKNEINSTKFQEWLCESIANLKVFKLEDNFRFENQIVDYNHDLRNVVLAKNKPQNKLESFKNIMVQLPFKEYVNKTDMVNELKKDEKYAFLVRDNFQVLKFSNFLRIKKVTHAVNRNKKPNVLDPFWGKVLPYYHRKTISYEDFQNLCINNNIKDNAEIDKKWANLRSLADDRSSKLEISEIFQNFHIKQNKASNLFLNENSDIIVSTIHQAKGKEFDNVYFLYEENDLDAKNIEEEAKVYYVAITRAIEKLHVFNFKYKKYKSKIDYDDRFVGTGWNRKKKKRRISVLEVGIKNDIDPLGFVSKQLFQSDERVYNNQEHILNKVKKGDDILLRRIDELERFYYQIFHISQSCQEKLIGKMSQQFSLALFKAFEQIEKYYNMNPKPFPYEIYQGLFVDNVCSYVQNSYDNTNLPKKFKDKGVWAGITITGLGAIRRRT